MSTRQGHDSKYEVLNPWADADAPSLRGLTPRLTDLEGKTLGLLYNHKLKARPMLTVIEDKLKKRFPTLKISWYLLGSDFAIRKYLGREQDTMDPKLWDWVNGVDAVISGAGD